MILSRSFWRSPAKEAHFKPRSRIRLSVGFEGEHGRVKSFVNRWRVLARLSMSRFSGKPLVESRSCLQTRSVFNENSRKATDAAAMPTADMGSISMVDVGKNVVRAG